MEFGRVAAVVERVEGGDESGGSAAVAGGVFGAVHGAAGEAA